MTYKVWYKIKDFCKSNNRSVIVNAISIVDAIALATIEINIKLEKKYEFEIVKIEKIS